MKILLVRFSSIGDIVLTSPVVRCISEQIENAEIHYLTKPGYMGLVESNPKIAKVHGLAEKFSETVEAIQNEKFDYIIDLHNNLRTRRLTSQLKVPVSRYNKGNLKKFKMVKFKNRKLKNRHVVERYLNTVVHLGVKDDGKGLEYHFPENYSYNADKVTPLEEGKYVCMAIGGQHYTKKLPIEQLEKICAQTQEQIIIIGGPEDAEVGAHLENKHSNAVNVAGKSSLNDSAWIVKESKMLVTHDTGMMHIGAALNKKILSVWGNTIPEFGMTPYKAHNDSRIFEVKDLSCRPCSKIGYDKCPKGHFKCMNEQNIDVLVQELSAS